MTTSTAIRTSTSPATGTAVLVEVAAAAILQYALSRLLARAVTTATEQETDELAR